MAGMPEDLRAEREEMVEEARKFSFDVDRFEREIDAGDMLARIIRGHIYLEHVLIQTLADAFAAPDEIELRRLNFPAKLDLCIALGLLEPQWRGAVTKMNEMRNRMAHRLEITFTDQDRIDLFNTVPEGILKDAYRDEKQSWENLLKGIVIWFDLSRQAKKEQRIRNKYSEERLNRLLAETKPQRDAWIAEQKAKGVEF